MSTFEPKVQKVIYYSDGATRITQTNLLLRYEVTICDLVRINLLNVNEVPICYLVSKVYDCYSSTR